MDCNERRARTSSRTVNNNAAKVAYATSVGITRVPGEGVSTSTPRTTGIGVP